METKKYFSTETEETYTEKELYQQYLEYLEVCKLSQAFTYEIFKEAAFSYNGTIRRIKK